MLLDPAIIALVSASFAAGGAWAGVRWSVRGLQQQVHTLRRDVDQAHRRIDTLYRDRRV